MPQQQNILGLNLVRMPNWYAISNCTGGTVCCFFEPDGSQALKPLATIVDFCDTWDLDVNGDIIPEVVPSSSGCWDIDSNGDIMPEAY